MLNELENIAQLIDGKLDAALVQAQEDSKVYAKHVTGEGIDEELQQFTRRENEHEFDQRKRLTCEINSSIANKIRNAFRKAYRSNGIKEIVRGKKEDSTDQTDLKVFLRDFTEKRSFKSVLQEIYLEQNMVDPNSFLLIDKSEDDIRLSIIPSTECLGFNFHREMLTDITYLDVCTYTEGSVEKEGKQINYLSKKEFVQFKQVSKRGIDVKKYRTLEFDSEFYYNGKELFKIEVQDNPLGYVPAARIGYMLRKDGMCDGIIQPALQYFKKLLKRNSEYDLSNMLHAFPQKVGYRPACQDQTCNNGLDPNGNLCKTCGGSGFMPEHASAQDMISMPLPKVGDEYVDINKIFTYLNTPTGILEYQQKELDRIEEKIMESIFNNDIFSRVQVTKTATEVSQKSDNANDTLYYFMEGFAALWKFSVDVICKYKGYEVSTELIFPNDFKLETLAQLIENHKQAIENEAPAFLVNQIAADIASKAFVDDPLALLKHSILQRLNPFAGESQKSIQTKLNYADPNDLYLYSNFNRIVRELENENEDFYTLPFPEIMEKTYDKVRALRQVNFDSGAA